MRNINLKYILLLCIVFVCNINCSSLMQIERQEDFSLKPSKIKEIISINPTFKKVKTSQKGKNIKTNKYSESVKQERKFNQILINNAQKNGIVLQIVDTDELGLNDAEYFEYLAPLRKEIILTNKLQQFKDINDNPARQRNVEFFYENAPKIASHFSHLAEIYGTPFFAIQGVSSQTSEKSKDENLEGIPSAFLTDNETLYYTIIADVSKSEIVYREFRQVNSEANESNLNSIIYDSFRIIAN